MKKRQLFSVEKMSGRPENFTRLIHSVYLSFRRTAWNPKTGRSRRSPGAECFLPATCFPTAATIANSWNEIWGKKLEMLLERKPQVMDVNMLLSPGLNIKRSPCGRNFEYFSVKILFVRKNGRVLYSWNTESRSICLSKASCCKQSGTPAYGNGFCS